MPMTRGFPETLTAQALFDKIATHLFAQRRRSLAYINGRDKCAYRDADGERCCAVGVVIPDDRYSPEIEGKSPFNEVFMKHFPDLDGFKVLLSSLQGVHDNCDLHGDGTFVLNDLRFRLGSVAAGHNLSAAAIPA
ncbi:hypothetical protein [Methylobacterium ajmalii]|uniref:hypothetical protein n=1 Tax=Methylobacterium ajmalii TaxID=2738439 RepID=UPI002F350345